MAEESGTSQQNITTQPKTSSAQGVGTLNTPELKLITELYDQVGKSTETLNKLAGEVERKTKEIESIKTLTYLGLAVIMFMFAAVLIDVWDNKGASSVSISNQVNQQNIEMQKISDKMDLILVNEENQLWQVMNSTSSSQLNNTRSLIKGAVR